MSYSAIDMGRGKRKQTDAALAALAVDERKRNATNEGIEAAEGAQKKSTAASVGGMAVNKGIDYYLDDSSAASEPASSGGKALDTSTSVANAAPVDAGVEAALAPEGAVNLNASNAAAIDPSIGASALEVGAEGVAAEGLSAANVAAIDTAIVESATTGLAATGTTATATTAAGGAAAGAEAGAMAGPVGLGIGAAVGLLATQIF